MFSSELKTGLMKVGDMTFHCGTSEEERQKYKKLLRLSISIFLWWWESYFILYINPSVGFRKSV